ncbi:F-box and associated interaction domains-containing protein [Striga asiatica]|uniref:F-box and associated interaction domains-containing protein n=1 Tax=Striga asiatica TaxID=4170 RepID=A0A5A7QWP3_STRAF|nr:F-box and associated interaction domains-containing protein [Striga asiatica]
MGRKNGVGIDLGGLWVGPFAQWAQSNGNDVTSGAGAYDPKLIGESKFPVFGPLLSDLGPEEIANRSWICEVTGICEVSSLGLDFRALPITHPQNLRQTPKIAERDQPRTRNKLCLCLKELLLLQSALYS